MTKLKETVKTLDDFVFDLLLNHEIVNVEEDRKQAVRNWLDELQNTLEKAEMNASFHEVTNLRNRLRL